MRFGALLLVLLGASGCTTVWTLQPPSGGGGEPSSATSPCSDALGALQQQLEERLEQIEHALARSDDRVAAGEVEAQRQERLLLIVELRQLEQAREGCSRQPAGARLEREELEALARERIAEARQQGVDGRLGGDEGRWPAADDQSLIDGLHGYGGMAPPACPPPKEEEALDEETANEKDLDADDGWARGDWSGERLTGSGKAGGRAAAAVIAEADRPVSLMPAVSRQAGAMLACLSPAEQQAGVALEVVARLLADGSLRVMRLTSPSGLTPVTRDCLGAVLAAVRVEPSGGGDRVITFPLSLGGD